jgi:leucine dehydrogenase
VPVFESTAFDEHERVVFCHDRESGLRAIIAINSTALGPAAGGCRMWRYANDDLAIVDALRLSKGMSYKNAMADLPFGGGKAVIIGDPVRDKTQALLESFGRFVDKLGGDYVTAEDVGMSVADMETISSQTRFVSGRSQHGGAAGGDPSPKTAYGVFLGIKAAAAFRLGSDNLEGVRVAVQGLGNVGRHLCHLLHDAGAALFVADIHDERTRQVCETLGATAVPVDQILFHEVDVIAPCALGGIFDAKSIPRLNASIIAGGANNQLASDEDGDRLRERNILYAPDYVINAGGIINVAYEYFGKGDDDIVNERIEKIGPRLAAIFERARDQHRSTNSVANELARERISHGAS